MARRIHRLSAWLFSLLFLTVSSRAGATDASALQWSGTIYAANAAVALQADRDCRGPRCAERYFSLVPIAGGLAQLAAAGFEFHDDHHGALCVPLTLSAVAGQAAGVIAYAAGGGLALPGPEQSRFELSIVPYQDGGTGAGLGVAWIF